MTAALKYNTGNDIIGQRKQNKEDTTSALASINQIITQLLLLSNKK